MHECNHEFTSTRSPKSNVPATSRLSLLQFVLWNQSMQPPAFPRAAHFSRGPERGELASRWAFDRAHRECVSEPDLLAAPNARASQRSPRSHVIWRAHQIGADTLRAQITSVSAHRALSGVPPSVLSLCFTVALAHSHMRSVMAGEDRKL